MGAIKIVAVPSGEAPLQVREAWVGIVLPLALPEKRQGLNTGVLTGPKMPLTRLLWHLTGRYSQTVGYLVESAVAISILSQQHPSAAQWRQQNTPEFLKPGRLFMFAADHVRCRSCSLPISSATGGLRVLVRESDVARARELLREPYAKDLPAPNDVFRDEPLPGQLPILRLLLRR